jgi:Cysteine-rich secretory protein family
VPIARRRHSAWRAASRLWPTLLAIAGLAALAVMPAPAVASDYVTPRIDFLSEETMRMVNLDRRGNGLATLASDPKLVNFARDLAVTCPTNSSLVLRGRARDMIDRAYFSHSIKGCYKSGSTLYSVLDILASPLGYKSGRGEIIASNYKSVAATPYSWGCDSAGANCNGTTNTPATVASVEYWWMHDGPHRAIILGSYDRFGCGMWRGTDGKNLYSCVFAMTGPNALDKTPPTVVSATGDGASVAQGSSLVLSASVLDNFRLSDGWVILDPSTACGGSTLHGWAYNLNVVSNVHSFTWNTTGVTKGTHALGWRVRDVSTLTSGCFLVHVTVT